MNDPADPFAFDETASFLPPQPYPGLRPFTKNEWQIFFGRESMTQDVVSRLLHKQFVAVHGDSGCGKSSLIAAGVMPLLEHDQARAGGRWTTCIMRPQDA
ncbi:MAG: ATP-binding protein, partial [Rhizobiales bacterium]|nr:ATP-binding protein [Hyphomicrobiales bacterium]